MRIDAIVLRELHMTLVRPFETSFGVTRKRRILLAEIKSEGLTGWGECTAGERPFFSEESTDSAWAAITQELGPMLAAETLEHGGDCPRIFRQVRQTAWPRQRWRMPSGILRRSAREFRSPICSAGSRK